MNILQSDVIALESELTNLAGELENYRQCVPLFDWNVRVGPIAVGKL